MIRTPLTERLGITYPIIQAGMGGVARAELVAAVSNAGGLGVIGAGFMSPAQLREEIRKVKDLTDKPFGVDLLLARDWPGQEEMIKVIIEERVPVFASGLGNPAPYVEALHQAGITVMAVVGTVRHARRVVEGGTDIVVAQGTEGGGHTGRIGTMALVPQVVDAVAPTPVVAAGGIADGRGLVAALALGACGVWVGTRFVATHEAFAHQNYKQKILQATEEDTVVTRAFTGKDCRVIRNRYVELWQDRQAEIQPFPFQMMVDPEKMEAAVLHGDTDMGIMPAGQIAGAVREVKSAGDIVREMMEEAEAVLSRLAERYAGLRKAP
ncbi:MAG: nitronate monooxygenase [Dehalococcoidia bacterium]|jgi:enoyl-[acyl-carrier protein] reductase II|nr:nitronate monooxygenase [Dehalococcoidia bacterium]